MDPLKKAEIENIGFASMFVIIKICIKMLGWGFQIMKKFASAYTYISFDHFLFTFSSFN